MKHLITMPWRFFMRAINRIDAASDRAVERASRDMGSMSNAEIDTVGG